MRALKAIVIVMGVLIAIGVAVLVVTIVNRVSAPPKTSTTVPAQNQAQPSAQESAPAVPLGPSLAPPVERAFGDVAIKLPPGGLVSDFSAAGDRLVLRVIMPDQQEKLLVVDLSSGKVLGTIALENTAPGPVRSGGGSGGGSPAPLPTILAPPRH